MALGFVGNLARSYLNSRISSLLGERAAGGDITITLSCGEDEVELPVIPEKYTCSVGSIHETVNIINAGDYLMMGKTGLKTITLESFFPAQEYDFSSGGGDPWGMVDTIERMRTSGEKIDFSISGSSVEFSCLIDAFEYGEQDGSGDVYYKISLREYREIGTDPAQPDEVTELNERKKPSFLEKAGMNLARNVLSGQPPMEAIANAVGDSGLTPKQKGYLAIAKAAAKGGGVSAGDVIGFNKNGDFQVNGVTIK